MIGYILWALLACVLVVLFLTPLKLHLDDDIGGWVTLAFYVLAFAVLIGSLSWYSDQHRPPAKTTVTVECGR